MIEGLKPYSAYKSSGLPWAPTMPEHWTLVPNRALVRRRKVLVGKRHAEYRLLSLTKQGVIVRDISSGRGKFSSDMGTSQEVRVGDLIFCLFDVPETPRTVGLSAHAGMITGAYTVFEPRRAEAAGFFELFYCSMDERKILSPLYSGLRNTIPADRFLGTRTPLPPPDEQAAIVRFLDHANRRIERYIRGKRKLIALLNEQKQAITHRAVTRGLDPNVPMKDSGVPLGEIPAHWEVRPLKAMCTIQSGVTLGKTYTGDRLHEFPYLRVANVQAGRVSLSKVKTIWLPWQEARRSTLQPGDVLMTEGGDPDKLGRGCVWEGQVAPCLHQNHVFAVRTKAAMLMPRFLEALLGAEYAKNYFLRTAKQTTNLASTNKTTIGNLRALVPPLDEQKSILAKLSEMLAPVEATRLHAEREIALMREYRTRLVSDVVTGQLDVREAARNLSEVEPDASASASEDTSDEVDSLDDDVDLTEGEAA